MSIKNILFLVIILFILLLPLSVSARILRIERDNVDAFNEANVNSYIVDTLYKNEIYQILDKRKGWYQLKLYGKKKGWVLADDVVTEGQKIATPAATKTTLSLDSIYAKSYAVLIAIDDYANTEDLNYAMNDAALLKRELKAIGFKEFYELNNESATMEAITSLFERKLLRKVKSEDRVFVFFAGKSVSLEVAPNIYEGYILPHDVDMEKFEDTSFSIDIIDAFLAKLAAKHVLVVYDTCFSGLSLKKAVSMPQSMPGYILKVTESRARQVITAGKHQNEMVIKGRNSLFIRTLIEGINGSAESGEPDGIVTSSELGAFLKLKVSIKSLREQTPDFGRIQGGDRGGELVFTRRRGTIYVTKEVKRSRDNTLTPEEEFLAEFTTPEEKAAEELFFDEEEGVEEAEVAGPFQLFPGELVVVPSGDFHMGSMDGHLNERPIHMVYVDAFYIGRYEVTNKEYKEFIDSTGYKAPVNVEGIESDYNLWEGRDYPEQLENQPIVNVSWFDAVAYCKWLSSVTGEKYRLPTEAEWEKAARGQDQRIYPWGNKNPNPQYGNYKGEWMGITTIIDVGTYEKGKSPYWVYEMAGNVWEWCSDWYAEDAYEFSSRSNPQGPEKKWSSKVVRGGSWASGKDLLRSTARYGYYPDLKSSRGGFRIVLEPER